MILRLRHIMASLTNNRTRRYAKRHQIDFNETMDTDSNVSADSKKAKRIKGESNKKIDNEPSNWREIYNNVVKMRSETMAPVDTMGCDQCFDRNIDEKQQRFQALVALMLSSQTKDQITYATMNKLREHNLSVDFINNISNDKLLDLIQSVGFFRRKAEYLKKTAKILKEQYNGDIPNTLEGLLKLPGVGPKMAHLAMKTAWNEVTGIGVDTHVHRICNRFHWCKTKTPEQTRLELEKWLPKDLWNKINHLLVGFGQNTCLPVKPKCDVCLNKKLCPSSKYFSF